MKLNTLVIAISLASGTVAQAAPIFPLTQNATKPAMNMPMTQTSGSFSGIEVNGGTVSFGMAKMGSMNKMGAMLSLSSDFKVPNSPAPHWQIVDAKGNVYLLNQLKIKDDMVNRSITLPSYIKSIAKVQIWCSFAEVNLGEATFKKPIMIG